MIEAKAITFSRTAHNNIVFKRIKNDVSSPDGRQFDSINMKSLLDKYVILSFKLKNITIDGYKYRIPRLHKFIPRYFKKISKKIFR